MDSVAFGTWLNAIRGLDTSQRGQAMRELALAEAGIPGGIHGGAATAGATPDAACMARQPNTKRAAAPRRNQA
jgi:hypothetical protein